jgi:mRNA interferase RelE/StbE
MRAPTSARKCLFHKSTIDHWCADLCSAQTSARYNGCMSWTALTVTWTKRAEKDLKALPKKAAQQVVDGVALFAATGQGDLKKMQDGSGYRLRVREWRVRCDIAWSALAMTINHVTNRQDGY